MSEGPSGRGLRTPIYVLGLLAFLQVLYIVSTTHSMVHLKFTSELQEWANTLLGPTDHLSHPSNPTFSPPSHSLATFTTESIPSQMPSSPPVQEGNPEPTSSFPSAALSSPPPPSPAGPTVNDVHETTGKENSSSSSPNMEAKPQLQIFIGIMSSPQHYDRRRGVRDSWMSSKLLPSREIMAKFFVGKDPTDAELNLNIQKEAAVHDDMIVMNHVEDYFNITAKTMKILEVGAAHQPLYVMKVRVTIGRAENTHVP